MAQKYTETLHEAQAELARLEERRAALLRLIEVLKVLSEEDAYELTPPPGYAPQGLTEEIRTVLRLTTVPLNTVQIRDSLIHRGFQASSEKNLLISVHTVLGRIENELSVGVRDNKPTYIAKVPFDAECKRQLEEGERALARNREARAGLKISGVRKKD